MEKELEMEKNMMIKVVKVFEREYLNEEKKKKDN